MKKLFLKMGLLMIISILSFNYGMKNKERNIENVMYNYDVVEDLRQSTNYSYYRLK